MKARVREGRRDHVDTALQLRNKIFMFVNDTEEPSEEMTSSLQQATISALQKAEIFITQNIKQRVGY